MSAFTLHMVTEANAVKTLPFVSSVFLFLPTKKTNISCLPFRQVLKLIHALALYEKDPGAVKATIELLQRNFFGGQDGAVGGRYAECMLAYVGGGPDVEGSEAVGFACYL